MGNTHEQSSSAAQRDQRPLPVIRAAAGGVLMGLANLVPGVSGGTMLLAAGVYQHFIDAIADCVALRFRVRSIVTLAAVILSAGAAILLLAGVVKGLVVDHRWIMYSLFIGLTLGGVPIVWKQAKPARTSTIAGAVLGFAGMAALALVQSRTGTASSSNDSMGFMLLAGIAGASAMILPGVSGGYLLLLIGAYIPMLASISRVKDGIKDLDPAAVLGEWRIIIPLGIGVAIGVVVVSQGLRWLLIKFRDATLGVLLGLLLGAVVGLWPFQHTVEPEIGSTLKGQTVIEIAELPGDEGVVRPVAVTETDEIEREDWPTATFTPSAGQIAGSLALIIAGFALTAALSLLDRSDDASRNADTDAASA